MRDLTIHSNAKHSDRAGPRSALQADEKSGAGFGRNDQNSFMSTSAHQEAGCRSESRLSSSR